MSWEESSPLQAGGAPGGRREAGAPGGLPKPRDQFPIFFFFFMRRLQSFLGLSLFYFAREKHSSRGRKGEISAFQSLRGF